MREEFKAKLSKLLKKKWASNALALCIAVLFFLLLSHINLLFMGISKILNWIAPVIYGVIIAYLINPVTLFFENKVFKKVKKENRRHGISVVFGLILVFAIIGILLGTLIPSLIMSIMGITESIEVYAASANAFAEQYADIFAQFNIDLVKMTNSWEQLLAKGAEIVAENTASIIATSQAVGKSATNFLLGMILAVYFLLAKSSLLAGLNRLRGLLLSDKVLEIHNAFFARCHKILAQFIGFDVLDGILVGGINAVLMAIFGMHSIALISVIVGITNLIPTFGPIIGAVVGAIILVLTNPLDALIFLIFTVIIQIFDGYILKPKMFGDSLGVPAVWILVSIIVGGKIFGIAGILLAIPFAAIFSFVYEENIIPKLQKRKDKSHKAEE